MCRHAGLVKRSISSLRIILIIFISLAVVSCKNDPFESRPNIVFILIDDMRWDTMSNVGHPFVRTPSIDRLATEGVRFSNAFVTTSLCSPSRGSFMTGQYAHTHGVRVNNHMDPNPSAPMFPQLLQSAGYESAFVGKWHMKPDPNPRPGFNYWLSFRGQGKYIDPELNENGKDFKAKGYMTDLLTDFAVEYLKKPKSKPFFLYLSHKGVHGPFTPAERHKDLYSLDDLQEPANFHDDYSGKPEWYREAWVRGGRLNNPAPPDGIPGAVETWTWEPQQTELDWYRALAAVDDSVGRLLDILDKLRLTDNTIVIFASDNGVFHGEHGRGDKRIAYEESIRIPLLIRLPGSQNRGEVISEMVLNIDVAPTILELAGVNVPPSMQGRSLLPLLDGESTQWRTSFLYEYFKENWLPGIPTMTGVRTTRWKYIHFPEIDDIDELYDLVQDPDELHNLAEDPAAEDQLAFMRTELERLIKDTGY